MKLIKQSHKVLEAYDDRISVQVTTSKAYADLIHRVIKFKPLMTQGEDSKHMEVIDASDWMDANTFIEWESLMDDYEDFVLDMINKSKGSFFLMEEIAPPYLSVSGIIHASPAAWNVLFTQFVGPEYPQGLCMLLSGIITNFIELNPTNLLLVELHQKAITLKDD